MVRNDRRAKSRELALPSDIRGPAGHFESSDSIYQSKQKEERPHQSPHADMAILLATESLPVHPTVERHFQMRPSESARFFSAETGLIFTTIEKVFFLLLH